jgi:hypothetical protein
MKLTGGFHRTEIDKMKHNPKNDCQPPAASAGSPLLDDIVSWLRTTVPTDCQDWYSPSVKKVHSFLSRYDAGER